ncbi:unnamed protein product [Candidula unifasciata]|uniref:Oxysterol-binding protein n=1 Tax=Candidula unifasciata TaxID=100452 RepID=A0A8S3YV40_9EUPU|nr:unnamed protein product [Candidula unifasciata]
MYLAPTCETVCSPRRSMEQGKKTRFKLIRAWSFNGKSAKIGSALKKLSIGSLDADFMDTPARKVHICDSPLETPDTDKRLLKTGDKTIMSGSKHSKRESLKEKKKSYRSQKKEVAREMMNSASDKSFVLMSDWLKVRGTLKGWTKLWCVCKPSMLIIYKSEQMKTHHWVGTILLNTCHLLQRPSKKEGFCFKLFHPLDQSIWATKGPKGETMGAFVQPLPVSYAIFRAPSENQGKCWMDGLEIALRCTGLIKRTTSRTDDITHELSVALTSDLSCTLPSDLSSSPADDTEEATEEAEEPLEHFSDDDDHSSLGMSGSDFELSAVDKPQNIPKVEETVYVCSEVEELGQQGDASQTEEVDDENRSLIWTLVKQVRPGMDLSKVVLPTFILEPRSFLDKLTDYYYHADILSQAVQQETALERMKMVVKWYLSGFYKKPKGLKKPYNPIIGETYRCYWTHPQTNSRTFYIAEQISHHPPISAFHVTNRHDGFNISGCILAKSKFYGNSISAILDGVATLTFLERGEDYLITMPYAHCKGILLGTLTMEMGGKVTLNCPKTGYHCDLDFKLKPFFGNGESANRITGCIRMGSEVLCTFEGHWDQQIFIKELTNRDRVLFWDPNADVRAGRLKKYTVPLDLQWDNESQRLWRKVSEAIVEQDMHKATDEKHRLEEKQRAEAKDRHNSHQEWVPRWFTLDSVSKKWVYKHADLRPWDQMTDCVQYEKDFIIRTQTVHTVPQVWRSPVVGQVRGQDFNSHRLPAADDSYSSDNNAAESDDTRYQSTKRLTNSSKLSVHSDTIKERTHRAQQKFSENVTHTSHKTSPKPTHRKLTFSQLGTNEKRSDKVDHSQLLHNSGAVNDVSVKHAERRNKESPLQENHDIDLNVSCDRAHAFSLDTLHAASVPSTQLYSQLSRSRKAGVAKDIQTLSVVAEMQHEMHQILNDLTTKVASIQRLQTDLIHSKQLQDHADRQRGGGIFQEWVLVAVILVFQTLLQWYFSH